MILVFLLLYVVNGALAPDPKIECDRDKILSHESFCLGIRSNKTSWQEGGCTLDDGNECDLWITAKKFSPTIIRWTVMILGFDKWGIEITFSGPKKRNDEFWKADGTFRFPYHHPVISYDQKETEYSLVHYYSQANAWSVKLNDYISRDKTASGRDGKWDVFEYETNNQPSFNYEYVYAPHTIVKWQTRFDTSAFFFHIVQFNRDNFRDIKNMMPNTGFEGNGVKIWQFVPPIIRPVPTTPIPTTSIPSTLPPTTRPTTKPTTPIPTTPTPTTPTIATTTKLPEVTPNKSITTEQSGSITTEQPGSKTTPLHPTQVPPESKTDDKLWIWIAIGITGLVAVIVIIIGIIAIVRHHNMKSNISSRRKSENDAEEMKSSSRKSRRRKRPEYESSIVEPPRRKSRRKSLTRDDDKVVVAF